MSVIEVDVSEFRLKLDSWSQSIHTLVRTLDTLAKLTDEIAKEEEMVPLFTGALEESFTYIVADGNVEMQVAMTYSSIAEDGYDYALAQHENYYRHPIQGYEAYLDMAMFELPYDERWTILETDYLSLFN